jgi:hypothetical protein
MDATIKSKIRKDVAQGATLAELLLRYHQEESWDIRTLFASTKREQVLEKVEGDAWKGYTAAPVISKKGLEAMNAGWMRPMQLSFSLLSPSKVIFEKAGRTTLVMADPHSPDQDPHAMDLVYQIGRSVGLDSLIIDGDLYNVSSLSKYTPTAEQHLRWVEERAQAVKLPVQIRQNFPDVPIKFLPGNHDMRPIKWINANALPLQGILTLAQWLGLDDPKLNFEIVEDGRVMLAGGNLMVKHGTSVSQNAGHSVKKEVDKAGVSVVMGHVHRRALIEVTKAQEILTGVEVGCLCNLTPDYGNPEDVVNWQQGFAIITEYDDDEFDIELVKIKNGRATFRGKRFKSRITQN